MTVTGKPSGLKLTQALAEAQADGVKGRTERTQGGAGFCGDMPDTSAVEMHLQALAVHVLCNFHDLILRKNSAIQSVLKRDYFCCGTVSESIEIGMQKRCARTSGHHSQ